MLKSFTMEQQLKWDKRFLELARTIASYSKDPSTQAGVVIVDGNRIISTGYNGLPALIDGEFEKEALVNRDVKYETIIHAEINAVIFAKRDLINHTVYTYPFMPCSRCMSVLIQAGINRVVSLDSSNERWVESFKLSTKLCHEANVSIRLYRDLNSCNFD